MPHNAFYATYSDSNNQYSALIAQFSMVKMEQKALIRLSFQSWQEVEEVLVFWSFMLLE